MNACQHLHKAVLVKGVLRHKRYNNRGGCRVMMRCCLYNVR
jgi:hypothetical protein